MIILFFGFLDILGGFLLGITFFQFLVGSSIFFYAAIVFLLKGLYSVLAALAEGFVADIMGYLDIVAGVAMLFVSWGIAPHYFLYIAIPLLIKGAYSMYADHPEGM